jgi:hypothetical protein
MANSSAGAAELYAAIRREAASRGCDAARVIGRSNGRRYGMKAACIVYKPAEASQGATARPAVSNRPATEPAVPEAPEPADAGADDILHLRR